jgi:hypothetical protein
MSGIRIDPLNGGQWAATRAGGPVVMGIGGSPAEALRLLTEWDDAPIGLAVAYDRTDRTMPPRRRRRRA